MKDNSRNYKKSSRPSKSKSKYSKSTNSRYSKNDRNKNRNHKSENYTEKRGKNSGYSKRNNFKPDFKKESMYNQDDYIIGVQPIFEALKSTRTINRILIAKGRTSRNIQEIVKMARSKGVIVQNTETKKISEIADGQNHQGIIAYVSPYDYCDFDKAIEELEQKENATVLILDHITDVHNFGSILRTCDASGVDYVIIPSRRSVAVNSTVSKTSAGAVEYTKITRVSSLSTAIKKLQKIDFWVYGLDMESSTYYNNTEFPEKTIIVAGSEDSGLSSEVKKSCDKIIKIDMVGKINSLNVSVATALVLYQVKNNKYN